MRRLFLADLHLHTATDTRFARFVECLRYEAAWADEIVILGDLFEVWVGDDDDSELAERACDLLRQTTARVPVLLMAGNRDFLCGARFAARTNTTLINDPYQTDDGLVLAHGDALCTGDEAYGNYRAVVRSSAWRQEMMAKPLDERRRIGAEMRKASAVTNANKPDNIMDVAPTAVEQLLREHAATVLIHGHTHRPGIHEHAGTIRYVLGHWQRCGWLLRQRGHRFRLECFSLAVRYRG